jgi:hypothetical protein
LGDHVDENYSYIILECVYQLGTPHSKRKVVAFSRDPFPAVPSQIDYLLLPRSRMRSAEQNSHGARKPTPGRSTSSGRPGFVHLLTHD